MRRKKNWFKKNRQSRKLNCIDFWSRKSKRIYAGSYNRTNIFLNFKKNLGPEIRNILNLVVGNSEHIYAGLKNKFFKLSVEKI